MNNTAAYNRATNLLQDVASTKGFLASVENTSNYKRVWARDGVICGLAALASGDKHLIQTFKNTLETLAENQHAIGTIPSNVLITEKGPEVSYGGLAGRVDAHTWFVIGVCQYVHTVGDTDFFLKHKPNLVKVLQLLDVWEFNNNHLIYVPLSGNWADEYITDGYVLYDQLLRIWALSAYNYFVNDSAITRKIALCRDQVETNFLPNSTGAKYHERAYNEVKFNDFMPCSFSPSGYKTNFDAFANALAVILNIGTNDFQNKILEHAQSLASSTTMGLLPAFWPPVFENDEHWNLLKNNCKYEFRNYPYEFHNGGSWAMVNGFYGLALCLKGNKVAANQLLLKINEANARENFAFYENFNTKTTEPNGVAFCAWSAAATVLVHQTLNTNFKILV